MKKPKKTNITPDDLRKTITGLSASFDEELFAKSESELEEYWHFKWDETRSIEGNIYEFYDMLELYSSFCRQWEEHQHNGYICVVERVRDKYQMPKIRALIANLKMKH